MTPAASVIHLDISRLLVRSSHPVPTGIDRVEMVYALHLLDMAPERLTFTAINELGRIVVLPRKAAERFVRRLDAAWSADPSALAGARRAAAALRLGALTSSARPMHQKDGVYLLLSHHHLDRPDAIDTFLRRTGSRFVCMVHDLIPIDFPEYSRPDQPKKHRTRMATVARLADAVLFNSNATALSFRKWRTWEGLRAPSVEMVTPLGVNAQPNAAGLRPEPKSPYFVCVGTIEPRKNHLLLLNVWRRLQDGGSQVPRLILIGRRGWENENVIDMLDRCAALAGVVEEVSAATDAVLFNLVAGARALLLPSFSEGYGLPLAEALAAGVPVICSDLPALREVGGTVPEYLDPLDGPQWMAMIAAFATDAPPRREQMARLSHWSPPLWDAHMAAAIGTMDTVLG